MLSLQAKSRQDYSKEVFNFKVEVKRTGKDSTYDAKISFMDDIVNIKSVRDFIETMEQNIISTFTHKDLHRENANALTQECIFFDFDNGFTIEEFKQSVLAQKFNWILVTSRSHQIMKKDKPAVERFHVFFPFSSSLKITDDNRDFIQKSQKYFVENYIKDELGFDVDTAVKDLARLCFPSFQSSEKINLETYQIEFNVDLKNMTTDDFMNIVKPIHETQILKDKIKQEEYNERIRQISLKTSTIKQDNETKNWNDMSLVEQFMFLYDDLKDVVRHESHDVRFSVATTIYSIFGESGLEYYQSLTDNWDSTTSGGDKRNWESARKIGSECGNTMGLLVTLARKSNPNILTKKSFINENYKYILEMQQFCLKQSNDSKITELVTKEKDEAILREITEEVKNQKIVSIKKDIENTKQELQLKNEEISNIDVNYSKENDITKKLILNSNKKELQKKATQLKNFEKDLNRQLKDLYDTNIDSFRGIGVQQIQIEKKDVDNQTKVYNTNIIFNGANYIEFFNSFCYSVVSNNVIIVSYADPKKGNKIMNVDDVMTEMRPYKIQTVSKNGMIVEKQAFKEWYNSLNKNIISDITFDPKNLSQGTTFNFCKNPIICRDDIEINKEELELFNEWIYKALSNNDKVAGDFFVEYLRCLVQLEKIKVAVQIMGLQGSGKSTVTELLRGIINSNYLTSTSSDNFLNTPFNAELKYKMIVILEEAVFQGDHRGISKLKDYITNDYIEINEKFMTPVTFENPSNFIFLSNADIITKLSTNDRRYFIMETNKNYATYEDTETPNTYAINFYKKFYNFLQNENGSAKIYNYLMKKKGNPSFLRQNIPQTTKKKEVLSSSMDKKDEFLLQCVQNNMTYQVIDVYRQKETVYYDITQTDKTSLYELFQLFCKKDSFKNYNSQNDFGKYLIKFVNNTNKRIRINGVVKAVYDFDMKKITDYFKKFGIDFDNNSTPPDGTDGDTSRSTDSVECLFDSVETKVEKKVSNGNTSKINGVTVELENKILKLKSKDFTIDEIADMLSCDIKAVEFVLNKGVKPLAFQQEVTPVVKSEVTNNVEPKSNLSVEITPVVEQKISSDSEMKDIGNNFTECKIQGRIHTFYKGVSLCDDTVDEIEGFEEDYRKFRNIKSETRSENQIDNIVALDDTIYETEDEIKDEIKDDFEGVGVIFNNTFDLMYCYDKKLYEKLEIENEKGIINVTFDFISESEFDVKYEHLM